MSAHNAAFPGAAADVSAQSSLFVVSGVNALPAGLALQVNGAAAPLPSVMSLGRGLAADGWGTFFRIVGPLQPSSDYVLAMTGADGLPLTLTHFQTAAGYDKTPGTAATLSGLRLWRVRYPKSLVNAGGCVFSEYEGYFALDYAPATLPGTPAGEVVYVLSLTSQELGTTQQFVFTGGVLSLPGGLTTTVSGDGVVLPEGGALSAGAALWKPDLEPGRTYCATLASYGRNDVATAAPLQSASTCATVVAIDSVAGDTTGGGGVGGGGGADRGGAGAVSAGGSGGTASYPIGYDIAQPGGGCGCRTSPGKGSGPALLIAAVALVGLRLRRRRSDV